MFEEDFLGNTQIYLQCESKDIWKTVYRCEVKGEKGQVQLYYRNGEVKEITIPCDISCFINISYNNEYIYVGSGDKKTLFCYQINNQQLVWKNKVKSDVGNIFLYGDKIYCQLNKGIFIFNASTGEEIGRIKKTDLDDIFTIGKDLLIFYFAGKLRCFDMKVDKVINEQEIFKREDDYSYAKIKNQTENSTTIKFFYGEEENPQLERCHKEIIFYEKDFIK